MKWHESHTSLFHIDIWDLHTYCSRYAIEVRGPRTFRFPRGAILVKGRRPIIGGRVAVDRAVDYQRETLLSQPPNLGGEHALTESSMLNVWKQKVEPYHCVRNERESIVCYMWLIRFESVCNMYDCLNKYSNSIWRLRMAHLLWAAHAVCSWYATCKLNRRNHLPWLQGGARKSIQS